MYTRRVDPSALVFSRVFLLVESPLSRCVRMNFFFCLTTFCIMNFFLETTRSIDKCPEKRNTGQGGKGKKVRTTSDDSCGQSVSEKFESTGGKCVSEKSTGGKPGTTRSNRHPFETSRTLTHPYTYVFLCVSLPWN